MVFEEIKLSARVASGTRFGDLPGSVLGPCWPSRCLQDHLKSAQDTPKTAQEASKTAPRAPKRPPRRLQERPRGLPGRSKRLPRQRQEAFRRPRGSKRSPGSHVGPLLPQFSIPFGRTKHPPTALRRTVCVCHLQGPELSQAVHGFSRHLSFPHASDPTEYTQG